MSHAGTAVTDMDDRQEEEARRRMRTKNLVLCAVLVAFVVVVYLVSIVRMGAYDG